MKFYKIGFKKISQKYIALLILGISGLSTKTSACELQFFGDFFVDEARLNDASKLDASLTQITSECKHNVVNMEGAIAAVAKPKDFSKKFNLNMSSKVPELLKKLNISYVSMANNHSLDFGWEVAGQTMRSLEQQGIKSFGIGKNIAEASVPLQIYSIFSKKNYCIFAFNHTFPESYYATNSSPGTAHLTAKERKKWFSSYKNLCDRKIAYFHWGRERDEIPQDYQVKIATELSLEGFDLILGHHPHIVQSTEFLKSTFVFYSLGNFIFATKPLNVTSNGSFVRLIENEDQKLTFEIGFLETNNHKVNYQAKVVGKSSAIFKKIYQSLSKFNICKTTEKNNLSLISCSSL